MANILDKDKQITAIAALADGSSIRAIERMTCVHPDTIMRLGVRVAAWPHEYGRSREAPPPL